MSARLWRGVHDHALPQQQSSILNPASCRCFFTVSKNAADRLCGLAKNTAQLPMLLALTNIWMARRKLPVTG